MDAALRLSQATWISRFTAWLRRAQAFYAKLGDPTDEDRQW